MRFEVGTSLTRAQRNAAVAAFGFSKEAWSVTEEKVLEAVDRLVKAAAPLRLIAFGSASKGELSSANDLDLLVVEPSVQSRYAETVRLQRALRGILMSVDVVVTTAEHFRERSAIPGTVEFTAHHQGRVLHDSL